MREQLEYKGYTGSIEYSVEDSCFYGEVLGIADLISYEGNTKERLESDFREAVDEYLITCKEVGKEPERAKGALMI